MLGILLTTLLFTGLLFGFSFMGNVNAIKKDWEKYRCRPDVMILAPMYGKDMTENLQYCLKQGFDSQAEGAVAPFYTFMKTFAGIMASLLGSINSIKMIFSTIIGSATTVFSNFAQRITALMYRIQMTVIRIKFMMSRVFAIMTAIIFMGSSGIKAGQNFSRTFLFSFLDTFCFDPDTPIQVKKNGKLVTIPIKQVNIGDILKDNETVTGTFEFWADGQQMVQMADNTIVSTNHYILHNSKWIQARDHPDATLISPWNGGIQRPLICLNTNTHSFTLGDYVYRDYDETSEGDKQAMNRVLEMLNGRKTECMTTDSTMACGIETKIRLENGQQIPAEDIILGTKLSHGIVSAVIRKQSSTFCWHKGERFAPGTAVWNELTLSWMRIGDIEAVHVLETPEEFVSFVVTPSAMIETASGTMFRDYVEIHDPDLETSYAEALQKESVRNLEC